MAAPAVAGGVAVLASALALVRRRRSRRYRQADDSLQPAGRAASTTNVSLDTRGSDQPSRGITDAIGNVGATASDNRSAPGLVGGASFQSLAAASAGALVTLYTPGGELIVVQQAGAPTLQRWALSTIRAPTQEDAPLGGEIRLPFFPAASLFSVVRKGTLMGFRSVGAGGRLLRAVPGRQLPGIGGHALGDGQSWWQQEAGLLVSCAHGGEVLALRAEEVRAVSRADVRTTERLHAAQLRGVTFELARSQEHLRQLRAAADEAGAAFQEHFCQASFQESRLVRQLKASIASEAQARSLADSACTLLQQQAADLADATAQREAATASAGRAARRAARLQGLLGTVRTQVQDHQTAQAAREAMLRSLAEDRSRLDAALSSIQVQLEHANAGVSREAARCKISLSPEAARVAARAARLSPPQRPGSAAPSLSGSSPSADGSPASTRGSGATCYSDFSSDGEEWADVAGVPAAGSLASAADGRDVSRKLELGVMKLDSSPESLQQTELPPQAPPARKLEASFQKDGNSLDVLGAGTPEIREPGNLRRTWGRRRLTAGGQPEAAATAGAAPATPAAARPAAAVAGQTSAHGGARAPPPCAMGASQEPSSALSCTPADSAGMESGCAGSERAADTSCDAANSASSAAAAQGPHEPSSRSLASAVRAPCSDGSADENTAPEDAATPAAQRLRPTALSNDSDSDVSESEAADKVPPLRLLYSGQRRSLNFKQLEYNSTDSDDSENDAASSHYSSAGSDSGSTRNSGGSNSWRPGLSLRTKPGPEPGLKDAGSEQRSPLRAFLRRHVQWGGK